MVPEVLEVLSVLLSISHSTCCNPTLTVDPAAACTAAVSYTAAKIVRWEVKDFTAPPTPPPPSIEFSKTETELVEFSLNFRGMISESSSLQRF